MSLIFFALTVVLGDARANTCASGEHFYYVVERAVVSYVAFGSASKPVSGADPATFKAVAFEHGGVCSSGKEEFYATDKFGVFFETSRVRNALLESFSVFPLGYYAKDARSVYFMGKRLKGADPETFRTLRYVDADPPSGGGWSEWAKDKRRVWRDGKIVPKLDPAAFAGPRQTD